MVVQMIHVGEQTGGLDTMLHKIADFYDEEVDTAVGALTSVIEPVLVVVMGVVIGSTPPESLLRPASDSALSSGGRSDLRTLAWL
jgi:hypothetical protein